MKINVLKGSILGKIQQASSTGSPNVQKTLGVKDYEKQGILWFECYDESRIALSGSKLLAGRDRVAAKAIKLGHQLLKNHDSVKPKKIISLRRALKSVKNGIW
jgi:hypothetical protein